MHRTFAAGAVILILLSALIGPKISSVLAQDTRPTVVATFSIVGDVVRNVGSDRVNLVVLVGADGDTERYEPTPGDAQTLSKATMIFENGLGSEPWLNRLYGGSGSSGQRVRIS